MGAIRIIIRWIGFLIRSVVKLMVLCIALAICLCIYARYIEPEFLTIQEETVEAKGLQLSKPIRIVQCSDLHLGPDYDMNHLGRIINKINELNPDIVVFTGDLIDNNKTFEDTAATIEALGRLSPRLGKYAVFGNHDYGENGESRYYKVMRESGFKLLVNESQEITLENNQHINMIGIDEDLFGEVDIPKAMWGITDASYNIVLCHEPDLADRFEGYPVNLQLSGHSHGGQIRIPGVGALLTPLRARKYVKGMYEIENNPGMKLYVNVGLGTSQARFRFDCFPELTVVTLN